MRQGFQKYSDMRQAYFLNSTCDMAINKRHATLAFLKIDRRHGDPPSRATVPLNTHAPGGMRGRGQMSYTCPLRITCKKRGRERGPDSMYKIAYVLNGSPLDRGGQ